MPDAYLHDVAVGNKLDYEEFTCNLAKQLLPAGAVSTVLGFVSLVFGFRFSFFGF
jgi:hypothetical protein